MMTRRALLTTLVAAPLAAGGRPPRFCATAGVMPAIPPTQFVTCVPTGVITYTIAGRPVSGATYARAFARWFPEVKGTA